MSPAKSTVFILVVAALVGTGVHSITSGSDAPVVDPVLPLAEVPYVLHDSIDDYADFMMSGGPPPDGIPSIDDPEFLDADEAPLSDEDQIIGIHLNGEARAYPQNILVYHEIVNDAVGGENVAVTYCPLTATAQGFKRGETTLGVSGQLLNSNLVMFDRETESYFSQITATGLTGDLRGETLDEVNLTWTTWGKWRSAHPDTKVLSEDTEYLRNYDDDPYGSYNPLGGYYQEGNVMFPLMHESDRHHSKEMVVGARTADQSGYFVLSTLEEEKVLTTDSFLAVYDTALHTGRIYPKPDAEVTPLDDGAYEIEGERYAADELPYDELVSVEAFYFAWHAFYPNSERT